MRILNVGLRFKPPPAPPHPPSTEQPLVERNPVRSSDPARGLQIHVRSPLVEHAPAAEVHAADHSGRPSIRAEARKRRLFRLAGAGRRYIAVIRRRQRRRLQRRERLPDPERPPLAPLGSDPPVRPRGFLTDARKQVRPGFQIAEIAVIAEIRRPTRSAPRRRQERVCAPQRPRGPAYCPAGAVLGNGPTFGSSDRSNAFTRGGPSPEPIAHDLTHRAPSLTHTAASRTV